MPLIQGKSKSAFSHNVSAEMHAGKPQSQSVAIAYSEKAKAEHKKHLAMGGKVEGCEYCMGGYAAGGSIKNPINYPQGPSWAEGGKISDGMKDETGMDADHETMLNECAEECMDAIKNGDRTAFRNALEVLIHDSMMKMDDEEE